MGKGEGLASLPSEVQRTKEGYERGLGVPFLFPHFLWAEQRKWGGAVGQGAPLVRNMSYQNNLMTLSGLPVAKLRLGGWNEKTAGEGPRQKHEFLHS